MSLGTWAARIAGDDEELRGILTDVPGPICGKIDEALRDGETLSSSRRDTPAAALPRRKPRLRDGGGYDECEFDEAWDTAEQAIAERDRAREGLEECRTAIETVREALVETVALYRGKALEATDAEAEIARLRSDLAAALERERMALWALALEIGDPAAAPAGFQWLYPGWYHAASGRSAHTRDEVHATHLAAILSIDPTAKPPPGWNP